MRPMTTRFPPICSVPHSMHSKLAGASAMRGGFTTDDGAAVQPGARQFIFAERQRRGALVHGLGDGFVHEVDDEFVHGADVERGVLGCAVLAVAGRERADGRIRAEQIEEAERRGIHPPSALMVVTSAIGRGVTRLARI